MDFESLIKNKVEEIFSTDYVDKLVETHIKTTTESIIKKLLESYSDFGKALREKISKSFDVDLNKMTLPEYHTIMLTCIKDEIDLMMKNNAQPVIKKRIDEFFKPLEKEEWKTSEILKEFKDMVRQNNLDDYDRFNEDKEITCILKNSESNDGYFDLYLDEKADTTKYSCNWAIRFNKDGIWHIKTEDGELHKSRITFLDSFERLLFKMYSQSVKVINDLGDRNIDTWIYSDND